MSEKENANDYNQQKTEFYNNNFKKCDTSRLERNDENEMREIHLSIHKSDAQRH